MHDAKPREHEHEDRARSLGRVRDFARRSRGVLDAG
jgi:hypothetical protein